MKPQLAYDAIALEYGGNAVFLRPSLRAAIHLERLHGGFPALLRKIEEFDTMTIWQVITAGAGRAATEPLFAYAAAHPLKHFQNAAQAACFELVAAFFPASPEDDAAETGPTIAWGDFFRQLYGYATGWLHWTPETAWNATPQEITDALSAFAEYHKAIYGTDEEPAPSGPSGRTKEERDRIIEQGFDPDFDRAGLRALKELSTMREGMML